MTILFAVLAFLLGVGVTWLWAVRTVHREVPVGVLEQVWGADGGAAAVATVRQARRHPDDDGLYDQETDDEV